MFNGNIWPNSAPLQDIRLRNQSDRKFDLSGSLKVKYDDVIEFSTYGFLFIYMSYRMSVSHRLAVKDTRNVVSYLLSF